MTKHRRIHTSEKNYLLWEHIYSFGLSIKPQTDSYRKKFYQFDICGEFIQSSNVIIWHSYFCEKCDNLKKHAVYQNTISLVSKEMKQQNGGCTMYIVTSQIDIVYIQWKNKFLLVGEIGVCTL